MDKSFFSRISHEASRLRQTTGSAGLFLSRFIATTRLSLRDGKGTPLQVLCPALAFRYFVELSGTVTRLVDR